MVGVRGSVKVRRRLALAGVGTLSLGLLTGCMVASGPAGTPQQAPGAYQRYTVPGADSFGLGTGVGATYSPNVLVTGPQRVPRLGQRW